MDGAGRNPCFSDILGILGGFRSTNVKIIKITNGIIFKIILTISIIFVIIFNYCNYFNYLIIFIIILDFGGLKYPKNSVGFGESEKRCDIFLYAAQAEEILPCR